MRILRYLPATQGRQGRIGACRVVSGCVGLCRVVVQRTHSTGRLGRCVANHRNTASPAPWVSAGAGRDGAGRGAAGPVVTAEVTRCSLDASPCQPAFIDHRPSALARPVPFRSAPSQRGCESKTTTPQLAAGSRQPGAQSRGTEPGTAGLPIRTAHASGRSPRHPPRRATPRHAAPLRATPRQARDTPGPPVRGQPSDIGQRT